MLDLSKAPLMGGLYPRCIHGTIEADDCIHTAMWTNRRLTLIVAVAPLTNDIRRKLGKAVVANCHIACEESLTMHRRFAGSPHDLFPRSPCLTPAAWHARFGSEADMLTEAFSALRQVLKEKIYAHDEHRDGNKK